MMSDISTGDSVADLSSHDAFVNGVPHATFTRLRKEDPVAWCDEKDGSGFWAITRHADIVELNRNFKTYTSSLGIRLEEMTPDETAARRTLMEMDPPEHSRLRRLAGDGFTRRLVETYEEQIRQIATLTITEALKDKEFDFVDAIAKQVPMRMLARLLGVPEEDGEWLVKTADELIGNTDPDFTDYVVDQVDTEAYRLMPFRSPAAIGLFEYAQKQAAIRRAQPGDDVITILLQPTSDGEPMSDLEFNNFFALLAAAGNDTTRYGITGSMHALANNPELVKQLHDADQALWDTAVEELLRWASPTMHFRRTATETRELHGKTIKQDDKVVLWFISGNRDETVFDEPFSIDLARAKNPHMTFGRGGPHLCLGMWLAKLELKVVLQEFLGRVKSVSQSAPEKHLRSNFINGIKYLPIVVEQR